jgi:hypothetical protein
MDARKYVGESFIKVKDVLDCDLHMQIAAVREGKYNKPDFVLETGDLLSCNATNVKTLMRVYGANTDGWVGKQIDLTLGTVEFQRPRKR